MKKEDIKELTDKEIREMIVEESTNLTKMKLSHVISPLENPMKVKETRRMIARLKTELRSRELNTSNNG